MLCSNFHPGAEAFPLTLDFPEELEADDVLEVGRGFAAAGAAIRYEVMHEETAGEILALDIAIPRNTLDWLENLPESITQHLEKKLRMKGLRDFRFAAGQSFLLSTVVRPVEQWVFLIRMELRQDVKQMYMEL